MIVKLDPQLNRQLYGLLNATGTAKQKENLVLGFTNGRSESTADLTDAEAKGMINYLQRLNKPQDDANKLRRKMFSLAHQMHWHIPGTQKVDVARLDGWCINYGQFKKPLNLHNYKELVALVTQFRKVYTSYLHKI